VYDACTHAGSPIWGRADRVPAKCGNFQPENTKGARRRPSIRNAGSSLALFVEGRIDLGDLVRLEVGAASAVPVAVGLTVEAEAEDAEVGAAAI